MMRKLVITLSLVAVIGAGVLAWRAPVSSPVVHGEKLSQEDVGRIRHAIRSGMWREVFPTATWQAAKSAPRRFWQAATARVREIKAVDSDEVEVRTESYCGTRYFLLINHGQDSPRLGWRILGFGPHPLTFTIRSPAEHSGPPLGRGLSFHDQPWQVAPLLFRDMSASGAATQGSSVSTESEFSASLSNRAKLTLGQ